jgi:hypothetical protein
MFSYEVLSLQSSHAASACCSDSLPPFLVLDIAASKHTCMA